MFAFFRIALSVIGVYGVLALLVSERVHEIAIRRALGAQHENIVWLVLEPALAMGGVGAAIGVACAWELRAVMNKLVFGISTAGPLTFGADAAILLIVVIIRDRGTSVARTRIDPMVALRYE